MRYEPATPADACWDTATMVVRTFFGSPSIPVWLLAILALWFILSESVTHLTVEALADAVFNLLAALLIAFLLVFPVILALTWLTMKLVAVPNSALWGVRLCIWETQAAEADVRKEIARRTRRIYLMPYNRWVKIDQRKYVYAPRPNTKRMTSREYVVLESQASRVRVTYVMVPRWKPRFWASRAHDQRSEMSKRGRCRPYIDKAIRVTETRSKTRYAQ